MSHTLNLVIVDDDQDDHDLLRDALWKNEIPFQALSLYNGQQLVDFLLMLNSEENKGENLPDLIVLDLNMPVMNGLEALKEIREIPRMNTVPVCLVSTCRNPEIPDAIINLSEGCYSKPFHEAEYAEFIDAIFSPYLERKKKRVG